MDAKCSRRELGAGHDCAGVGAGVARQLEPDREHSRGGVWEKQNFFVEGNHRWALGSGARRSPDEYLSAAFFYTEERGQERETKGGSSLDENSLALSMCIFFVSCICK